MYNYLITKKFIDLKSSKNSVGWGIRIFLSSRYNGNRTLDLLDDDDDVQYVYTNLDE